jgi:hypothetical protein
MRAAFSKAEIESEITSRFGSAFTQQEKKPAEVISSGLVEVDSFTGGLPRGAITEVFGPASSGRTSFMLATLGHATNHDEVCALVDTSNGFDPKSATRAEINCERLLWIRCANNLEHAFKATDLLLQGGGFGLVLLDLADVPAKSVRRIISSWWYRFRRTLEATPTSLVVIAEDSCVRSCATLALELSGGTYLWSAAGEVKMGDPIASYHNTRAAISSIQTPPVRQLHRPVKERPLPHANLLQGLNFQMECRRPLYLNTREQEVLVQVAH